MAESTWITRELPILEAIADAESRGVARLTRATLAELAGLSETDAGLGYFALIEDGYIVPTRVGSAGSAGNFIALDPRLRAKGRRAIGQWPGDDPFRDLVNALERLIASTDEAEEKTRLEKLRGALLGLGEKVGTAVAIAWGQAILGPKP